MRRDAVGDDDCLSVKRVIRACECALRKQTRDPTVVGVREGTAAKNPLSRFTTPYPRARFEAWKPFLNLIMTCTVMEGCPVRSTPLQVSHLAEGPRARPEALALLARGPCLPCSACGVSSS